MTPPEAESVLFTDNAGNEASLEDIIAHGLDGAYRDRVPALLELLNSGAPYHRLMACIVLMSWGHPAGFEAGMRWAENPAGVPWADAPVTTDRIFGVNDAFENLADALKTSYWNVATAELRNMQRDAAAALLAIYPDQYFGRTLALALLRDPVWREARRTDVTHALQRSLQVLRSGATREFDLPVQTASLLFATAPVDESSTAMAAKCLINEYPQRDRVLQEVGLAIAGAAGDGTRAILQRLQRHRNHAIAAEATNALLLRQQHDDASDSED
jgi:hypothetical protein